MAFNNRYNHLSRYKQILYVFFKHGFGGLTDRLGIEKYLNIRINKQNQNKIGETENSRYSVGERLRLSLEELGPTFIKLGQMISTRPDILPADIIVELEKLQTAVPPFPFEDVKSLIENEFDDKFENVFKEFDKKPLAAASIAQVHHATLNSGENVVVKIQRPGIERNIFLDLKILADLASFVDNHTKYGKLYSFSKMVKEFENTLNEELDFRTEGENAEKFKENAVKDEGVIVPRISWVHTTRRVLTMEYIDGIRINDFAALDKLGLDRKKIAHNLAISMLNQILRDGFFHGDPHPGNILVLPDHTIAYLDLGMVGKLDEGRKSQFIKILMGIAFKNTKMITQALIDLDTIEHHVNINKLEREIENLRDKYLSLPLTEINIGEVFNEVFSLAFSYNIVIPSEFTMLAKSLVTLEGLVSQLDPELNVLEIAEPIARGLMFKSISIEKIGEDIYGGIIEYWSLLKEYPAYLNNFLRKMESDEFAMQFQLKGMGIIASRFDRVFSRLTISIVILALSFVIAGITIFLGINGFYSFEILDLSLTVLKFCLILGGVLLLAIFISILRSYLKK